MEDAHKKQGKKTVASAKDKPQAGGGAAAPARTPGSRKVGDILREAREKKDKTVEAVSAVINVRVAQIKGLESGNLASLPGMTYAIGFLRSYAHYLGLDSDELVRQFKLEHTEVTEKPDLHFPVPVSRSHLPDPVILAGAGVGAVVLLIVLAFIASSGDDKDKAIIAEIPAVVQAAAPAPASAPATGAVTGDEAVVGGEVADVAATAVPVPGAEAVAAGAPVAVAVPVSPPSVLVEAVPAVAVPDSAPVTQMPPVVPAAVAVATPGVVPLSLVAADGVAGTVVDAASGVAEVSSAPSVVPRVPYKPKDLMAQPRDLLASAKEFGAGKSASHVVIEASKPSWIQIMDGKENIIFKKVLQAGERYNVPSTPGLMLTTSNAGGLSVYVDGTAVQSVGGDGEIIRGISLDPRELSRQRIKVRR